MTSSSPAPAGVHGSHARAYAVVRVDTPGGRVEQPCDDEETVDRVSVTLLALVAEHLRGDSTLIVIRPTQPKETP